jgi:hypothetical protein
LQKEAEKDIRNLSRELAKANSVAYFRCGLPSRDDVYGATRTIIGYANLISGSDYNARNEKLIFTALIL